MDHPAPRLLALELLPMFKKEVPRPWEGLLSMKLSSPPVTGLLLPDGVNVPLELRVRGGRPVGTRAEDVLTGNGSCREGGARDVFKPWEIKVLLGREQF